MVCGSDMDEVREDRALTVPSGVQLRNVKLWLLVMRVKNTK